MTCWALKHERRHVFGQKSAYSSREHGTSGWQQMEHRFSDHFGKNEKRGIPLKVFLFSEKFPVERPVPFDFPPERPVFPHKWKALLVSDVGIPHCVTLAARLVSSFSDPWSQSPQCAMVCPISVCCFLSRSLCLILSLFLA